MVFELKPPLEGSKGILVFTHKERGFFERPLRPARRTLDRLKQHYVLGMHWGGFSADVDVVPWVDFHLAGPGTVRFRDPDAVHHIPLCSRDFVPDMFRPMASPDLWDVLCIARPIRVKRMTELLHVVRAVLDAGVRLRVLLLCPVPRRLRGRGWDPDFFRTYETLFTEAEREHVELVTPVQGEGLFPLPKKIMPFFYNASRTFTLFSRREGESRVVSEAVLCGTPVVVRSDLMGGGRDHLDAHNSLQFDDLDGARDLFIRAAEGDLPTFDVAPYQERMGESASVPRLEVALRDLFASLGEPWAGAIDGHDLANRLPSHTTRLPRRWCHPYSDDLRDHGAFLAFVSSKLGEQPAWPARVWVHATAPWRGIRRRSATVGGLARAARGRMSGRRA